MLRSIRSRKIKSDKGPLSRSPISEGKDLVNSEDYVLKNGSCFYKAIEVSQMPIGKTPRLPTYLGVWTRIRT